MESPIVGPEAKAFTKESHEAVRRRFDAFHEYMTSTLYRVGAMDDRQPQMMIVREVLRMREDDELSLQLARRYLWASYDCVDYSGGVMLVHSALAEPRSVISDGRPHLYRRRILKSGQIYHTSHGLCHHIVARPVSNRTILAKP